MHNMKSIGSGVSGFVKSLIIARAETDLSTEAGRSSKVLLPSTIYRKIKFNTTKKSTMILGKIKTIPKQPNGLIISLN